MEFLVKNMKILMNFDEEMKYTYKTGKPKNDYKKLRCIIKEVISEETESKRDKYCSNGKFDSHKYAKVTPCKKNAWS